MFTVSAGLDQQYPITVAQKLQPVLKGQRSSHNSKTYRNGGGNKKSVVPVMGRVWRSTQDRLLIESCRKLCEVRPRPPARAGDVKGRVVTTLLILGGCNVWY